MTNIVCKLSKHAKCQSAATSPSADDQQLNAGGNVYLWVISFSQLLSWIISISSTVKVFNKEKYNYFLCLFLLAHLHYILAPIFRSIAFYFLIVCNKSGSQTAIVMLVVLPAVLVNRVGNK